MFFSIFKLFLVFLFCFCERSEFLIYPTKKSTAEAMLSHNP